MEDEYLVLKKKFSLPDLNLLDKEFEVSAIEEYTFLLRSMRVQINDKIEHAVKIFNDLLHPESGFAAYREANIFSEPERNSLLSVYKRLMFYNRRSIELDFDDSDELNAKFINDLVKDWPELKKSILFFVRKMKDSWKIDITTKDVVGYFG